MSELPNRNELLDHNPICDAQSVDQLRSALPVAHPTVPPLPSLAGMFLRLSSKARTVVRVTYVDSQGEWALVRALGGLATNWISVAALLAEDPYLFDSVDALERAHGEASNGNAAVPDVLNSLAGCVLRWPSCITMLRGEAGGRLFEVDSTVIDEGDDVSWAGGTRASTTIAEAVKSRCRVFASVSEYRQWRVKQGMLEIEPVEEVERRAGVASP